MSSIGKLAATLATYPILTIKTQLQAEKTKEKDKEEQPQERMSMISKIIQHYNEVGGFFGLYKGLEAKIIQTLLYNAFLMIVYEKLRNLIKYILFKSLFK